MKKTKYKIRKDDGTWPEVEGYVFNEQWGIDKRANGRYVLTHIPTGCFVDSSRTLKFLKLMVQEPEFFDEVDKTTIKSLSKAISRFRNSNNNWS